MFEGLDDRGRGRGGPEVLFFLTQQMVATLGSALLTYPIYLDVEEALHGFGEVPMNLWRWGAMVLPVIAGFCMGFVADRTSPRVYRTGRFVWILPVMWFFWMFWSTLSVLPVSQSVGTYLADAGAIEMTIGACGYSAGVIVAHCRSIRQNAVQTRPEHKERW